MAVFTPTDRPNSFRNRCLIELFVALFMLSLCPFDISVEVGAFIIGLGQIFSFLFLVRSLPFFFFFFALFNIILFGDYSYSNVS